MSGSGNLLLGGNSTYSGSTAIAGGGNITVSGRLAGTSNLFLQQGTATIAAGGSITTSNYSSVGQLSGNSGTLNVSGALTVNGDFNTGDNGTGVTNLLAGGRRGRSLCMSASTVPQAARSRNPAAR